MSYKLSFYMFIGCMSSRNESRLILIFEIKCLKNYSLEFLFKNYVLTTKILYSTIKSNNV